MTQSVTGTGRQVLHLSLDMGNSPALSDIATYADQLSKFWELAFWSAYQEGEVGAAFARQTVGAHHDMQRALRIRRMTLGSPWDVVLATLTDKAAFVACAATALITLERVLHAVMDWQRHSSDLADSALARSISERIARQVIQRYDSDVDLFHAASAIEGLLRRPVVAVELIAEDVAEDRAGDHAVHRNEDVDEDGV